jgi:hypothetical protein
MNLVAFIVAFGGGLILYLALWSSWSPARFPGLDDGSSGLAQGTVFVGVIGLADLVALVLTTAVAYSLAERRLALFTLLHGAFPVVALTGTWAVHGFHDPGGPPNSTTVLGNEAFILLAVCAAMVPLVHALSFHPDRRWDLVVRALSWVATAALGVALLTIERHPHGHEGATDALTRIGFAEWCVAAGSLAGGRLLQWLAEHRVARARPAVDEGDGMAPVMPRYREPGLRPATASWAMPDDPAAGRDVATIGAAYALDCAMWALVPLIAALAWTR